MPFYSVWEKKTVFLVETGSSGPPAGPPGSPPGIWPGPHPSHPIMLPGMPGWGTGIGGGPIYPPEPPLGGGGPAPPSVWPGPAPSHPIMLPGMPGWAEPAPPDERPPFEPPVILPDFASKGFWTYVVYATETRLGWIQTSLSNNPNHEPDHPEKGLPGEWISVYSNQAGYTYAWLPTKEVTEPTVKTHTKKGTKHAKPHEP